eukprot:gene15286-6497_t
MADKKPRKDSKGMEVSSMDGSEQAEGTELNIILKPLLQIENFSDEAETKENVSESSPGHGYLRRHSSLTNCEIDESNGNVCTRQRSASSCSVLGVQMASKKALHVWRTRASSASSLSAPSSNE